MNTSKVDIIDVTKNKASGKYFICVEELDNEKAVLITPSGEIKALDLGLFHELELLDGNLLLSRGLISKRQIEQYHTYT